MTEPDLNVAPDGIIAGIVKYFISGPPAIIFLLAAACLGVIALVFTPSEEEPQIVVPMANVLVDAPGLSPREVEEQVTRPLERILWQIAGVEHIYSISRRDQAFVTVRFFVGQDREKSIVNLRDQIESNRDIVPAAVSGWVVKPAQIDDVPIVLLTLYSPDRDVYDLRRVAEEVKARLDSLDNIFGSEIHGGQSREIMVEPDMEAMAARNVCIADIELALRMSEPGSDAAAVIRSNHSLSLHPASVLSSAHDVRETIIRSPDDRAIRVKDVADVFDGPGEIGNYHFICFGSADTNNRALHTERLPAVTLSFAKKPGSDAIFFADQIISKITSLQKTVIPDDIGVQITRNYGETAHQKVNNLLSNIAFAILTVVALLAITIGWRESLVVGLAVPISFALALFVNYLSGYTINRVTLFALILSLGLVVDDPITNVDSIQRHIRHGLRTPYFATLWGVKEVIAPVIISTLTIIICFLPMFFITGMMGPYMRPMAINVPLAVSFSTICAITFVPWLAYHLLKYRAGETSTETTDSPWISTYYRLLLSPFLDRRRGRFMLAGVALLFAASCLLVLFGKVPLKLLPFDNKDEFQIIVDLPEGSPLEQTDLVCQELQAYLSTVAEVHDSQSYAGMSSPINFNGLVRNYGFRRQANLADICVTLVNKNKRKQQSHDICLRLRDDLTRIAERYSANISIVEIPPGPPVLSTIVGEVYGSHESSYTQIIDGAQELKQRMAAADSKHIVQIDDMSETQRNMLDIVVNRDKAARHGLTPASVAQAIRAATIGISPCALHIEHERNTLPVRIRLPYADRMSTDRLAQLWLHNGFGKQVQLGEIADFVERPEQQPVFRKDLERVMFVTAESVGRPPGNIILQMMHSLKNNPLPQNIRVDWSGEGEWQITLDVFRDLGIAFGIALIGIYLILVLQTGSFALPGIMMLAIPLTAIGILPGFWLLNSIANHSIGGYPTPIFFTATAMIGMIALGGIVIRNSSVLIEFVHQALANGVPLREALLQSGIVRFRPIVLTALTTMLGVWPITLDPIFAGLAWSLIFGLLASTLFTLLVIPTAYFQLYALWLNKN